MMENRDVKCVSSSGDEMLSLEDCSDVEVEDTVQDDLLVTRRVSGVQPENDQENSVGIFLTQDAM